MFENNALYLYFTTFFHCFKDYFYVQYNDINSTSCALRHQTPCTKLEGSRNLYKLVLQIYGVITAGHLFCKNRLLQKHQNCKVISIYNKAMFIISKLHNQKVWGGKKYIAKIREMCRPWNASATFHIILF